ncbi:protein kinase [Streptomyces inhibens]|uniref:protein kinase domain-containing protein n=1 Tax=Streptomyces inhibens TaxID=2293571 RepID=UPI00378958F7
MIDGRSVACPSLLLTDFGIAVHHADTALTTTGAVIGSMEYMAPERARGTDGLAASDPFSLGVTLYQALEGVSPFRRDTPTGCLAAVLSEQAPPPVRAGRLEPLITGLLDKDQDQRLTIPAALALIDAPETAAATRIDRFGQTYEDVDRVECDKHHPRLAQVERRARDPFEGAYALGAPAWRWG